MNIDFPPFIEELVHEGARANGFSTLDFLCFLVCEDANRREEARKNPPRLPEPPPGARERALKRVLELREKRLKAEAEAQTG
jgi:hypothetical protein